METIEFIRHIEEDTSLPAGNTERFKASVVIGLLFHSGHFLRKKRRPVGAMVKLSTELHTAFEMVPAAEAALAGA